MPRNLYISAVFSGALTNFKGVVTLAESFQEILSALIQNAKTESLY